MRIRSWPRSAEAASIQEDGRLPKLFHLRASPRPDSASGAGADAFVDRFNQTHPGWDIDTLDLWRESLPDFQGAALEAKYARQAGRTFNDRERDAFAVIERMVVRLAVADRVLISTPMWNFGIPYKLKQYIDLIVQPGLTFSFDPNRGYSPLLQNRPTLVILASGGDFVTGMNRGRTDMATPYLRDVLRFIGLSDQRFVLIGPTVGAATPALAAREAANRRLAEIAHGF
jgi:FMN-dependent NADH-azoreductase